ITPSQPAPVSTPTARPAKAKANEGTSLLKKLINWLTGAGTAAKPAEPEAETAGKSAQGHRKNGRHNDRRERGHGDRNRHRRGDRRQETADGRAEDVQAASSAPKPRRQPAAQEAGAQAGNQSRSAAVTTASAAAPAAENGDGGSSGRSGRNRRGRGRN